MEKDTKEAWIIMYTYYSTDEWYGGFPDNLYQWFVCDFTDSKLPTIFNSENEANEYIKDGALVNAKAVPVAGAMAVPTHENSGLHKHIVNCFKTDGEQLIKTLGFELDCEYDHDHFHTNRYRKGLLMVEFTYSGFRLETVDLTIDETFCKPITYAELKAITPVLGEIPA